MKYCTLFFLSLFLSLPVYSGNKTTYKIKTVVIDAGHGGKDPGASGKISKEKDVVLKVALLVGDYISKNLPDVKVIYTRSTDRFIELNKRADIANKNKADLFISIHANSLTRNNVAGCETYIMGISRNDENFEVAKMENSVITYEDDYTQNYAGFDPSSAESYIIFRYMQSKYLDQSLKIAQLIQDQFRTNGKRIDRGVRQAGFLVLRNTGMPSILVELGYMSNVAEEKYMNSKTGQQQLATSIYRAFKIYKEDTERKSVIDVVETTSTTSATPSTTPATTSTLANAPTKETTKPDSETVKEAVSKEAVLDNTVVAGIIYKVQLFSTFEKLSKKSVEHRKYKDLSYYKQGKTYRYMVGNCKTYKEVKALRTKMLPAYKDAFIVAFEGDKKIDVRDALKKLQK